jgi:glycosyl transferase family 61
MLIAAQSDVHSTRAGLPSDVLVRESIGPIRVPASLLYCHPSRLANTYETSIDKVVQDEFVVPGQDVTVSIKKKKTLALPELVGVRTKIRAKIESVLRKGAVNLGEALVYDARFTYNGNMAHLIQHHFTNLGLIRAKLGLGVEAVKVVLDGRPPKVAESVFQGLGYETYRTDLPISANVIEVAVPEFFHLLPCVSALEVKHWVAHTPRRVFIARRDTRRLRNQSEIAAFMTSCGFETLYFEDYAPIEQWSIIRGATQVVAIHGAALGCLAFRAFSERTQPFFLTELFGPGFVVNVFRKYLAALGGSWVGCRGKVERQIVKDVDTPGKEKVHAFDDFELSPRVVEEALRHHQRPSN